MHLINRSILHERINFISLLLVAFTLPFHILLCSYTIALFVLNQLAQGNLFEKAKTAFTNKLVLLFIGFFLLHLVGLFYTDNLKEGLFDLEKKVSLLIFPIFLSSLKIEKKQVVKILGSFVAACFILTLIFMGTAIYKYIYTGNSEHFFLQNLSSATGIHRVYASMYLLFCIYILVFFIKRETTKENNINLLLSILIVYFTIILFLLASRVVLLLTVLSFIGFAIAEIIQSKKVLKTASLLILFFFISGSFMYYNESIRNVMTHTYEDLDKGNSEFNNTGPNQRIEIWKAATPIIQNNFFGVGTGDTDQELYKSYVSNTFIWGIKNKYNAHNQYIQTTLGLGIIGLSMFLLTMAWPALLAFKKKYFLYLSFIALFSICCLTESLLCSQKGIVFYAFFNSLLVFLYPKEKN